MQEQSAFTLSRRGQDRSRKGQEENESKFGNDEHASSGKMEAGKGKGEGEIYGKRKLQGKRRGGVCVN